MAKDGPRLLAVEGLASCGVHAWHPMYNMTFFFGIESCRRVIVIAGELGLRKLDWWISQIPCTWNHEEISTSSRPCLARGDGDGFELDPYPDGCPKIFDQQSLGSIPGIVLCDQRINLSTASVDRIRPHLEPCPSSPSSLGTLDHRSSQ